METMNFNMPVVIGIIRKATEIKTDTSNVASCLELYETLSEEEWREMVLGIVYSGDIQGDKLSLIFGKVSFEASDYLPLFSGGGMWGQHDPIPYGIATVNSILMKESSAQMKKKIKNAFDLVANEGLEKKNEHFLDKLMLCRLALVIDCEIVLRIYVEMKGCDCSHRALSTLIFQVKHGFWENSLPFSYWQKNKDLHEINLYRWLAICAFYKRSDVFMESLATLKEWPDLDKVFDLEYHLTLAINEDHECQSLLKFWPQFEPSVQKGLISFFEKNIIDHKMKYSSLFVKDEIIGKLKKM